MEMVLWPTGTGTLHTRVTSVREAGWNSREDCVYIGLPGYAGQETGYFGKPWKLLNHPKGWRFAYIEWLNRQVESDAVYAGAVVGLHGKTLVCFCKGKDGRADQWCHGDYLAYMSEVLYHYVFGR